MGRVGLSGSDIDLAGDGLVDDGLSLFLEQGDQLLLGSDVALDASVGVVEEVGDGGLFGEGGNARVSALTMPELSPCMIEPFPATVICSFT